MEEALRTRLKAAPAIRAIVDGRVDWGRRTGATLPSLTMRKMAGGRDYTFDGACALEVPRVRFSCWGSRPGEARRLARALTEVMEQPAEVDGVKFDPAFVASDVDMPSEAGAAGTVADRVEIDFYCACKPV
jgi:hypothetical protein